MGKSRYNRFSVYIIVILIICILCIIFVKPVLNGFENNPIVYRFFNRFHYGDNILNLKFLYNISHTLKEQNIKIEYYYDNKYIKNIDELDVYVNNSVVTLIPLEEKPESAIELWMGNPVSGTNRVDSFDYYYSLFYRQILANLNLDHYRIDTSLYQKEDYLLKIYENMEDKYKELDILFINSEPKSGQFIYDTTMTNEVCMFLFKKYKIATTSPVNSEIPCTLTDGLKIQDIGAISTHAKCIIGANTGPICGCFNTYTKNNVIKWYLISDLNGKLNEINVEYIQNYNELMHKLSLF